MPEVSNLPIIIKEETCEIVEQPLPGPFPLPTNFRSDMEVCLHQKHMTKEAQKSFISTVASKMFSYKRKPTTTEFMRIATDIIRKYPFMKPTDGEPTVWGVT